MGLLLKNKQELNKLLEYSAVVTVNNELLYYYYNVLCSENICCTIDGFYLQKYYNIFAKSKVDLIIGKDIYEYFLDSRYSVLIIGGDDEKYIDRKFDPYVRISSPRFSDKITLVTWLNSKAKFFENFDLIFVMFTGQKQRTILEYAHRTNSKATFIGLGGTLDQVFGYQNIPKIIHGIGLVWLYRTIFYYDSTKMKKLGVSLLAFTRYRGFRKLIRIHED